jgi:hypothetical protein
MIVLAAVVGLAAASGNMDENGVCHVGYWYESGTKICKPCTNPKPSWAIYLTNGGANDCLFGCPANEKHVTRDDGTEGCEFVPTKFPTSFPTTTPTSLPTANPTCYSCKWSDWSEPTQCSTTCGPGHRFKKRKLFAGVPNHDPNCPCHLGTPGKWETKTLKCNNPECDQDCILGDWGEWLHPDPKLDPEMARKNIWDENNYVVTCSEHSERVKDSKDCSEVIPDKAIHWAEKEATKSWGPYLAKTPTKMTQADCIKACEQNDKCAGWSYRYGNPKHVHHEKCFLLDASHTKYAPADAKGDFHSGICKSSDEVPYKSHPGSLVHAECAEEAIRLGRANRCTGETGTWGEVLGGRRIVKSANECASLCENYGSIKAGESEMSDQAKEAEQECMAWTMKEQRDGNHYCFLLDQTATTPAVIKREQAQNAFFKTTFTSAVCKKTPTNLLVHRTREIDFAPTGTEGKACRATIEYKPWHDHCYHVMGAEKNERTCENQEIDCVDEEASTMCKHHASRCSDTSFSRVDVHYHKTYSCKDLRDRTELP